MEKTVFSSPNDFLCRMFACASRVSAKLPTVGSALWILAVWLIITANVRRAEGEG